MQLSPSDVILEITLCFAELKKKHFYKCNILNVYYCIFLYNNTGLNNNNFL